MSTVAFVHAHPDDEAIFSGGTIAALVDAGHRVVLVVATGGELGVADLAGEPGPGDHASGSGHLGAHRRAEADAAAGLLGVDALYFLDHHDSGMAGDPANHAPGAFWSADAHEAALELAEVLGSERVDTLAVYDSIGIYGHPDHVQGHRVGLAAADLVGIECRYEMTVDREYLHFVETHLVEEAALTGAARTGDLGLARSRIGSASVEIDLTLDVRRWLPSKRAAMAAHASQLPEHSPVFGLDDARFADVYGYEWFVRRGRRGPLDELLGR